MSVVKKYRKKPVEIEARRFSGIAELIDVEGLALWCGGEFKYDDKPGQEHKAHYWSINIPTLEGTMRAVPGDFIIKGVQGEFYPCKPDIFAATYEAADARATVPDAVTERVTENSVRHVKQLTTELQNKRESLNDQRREFRNLLADARAERDAALARIAEAAKLHRKYTYYDLEDSCPDTTDEHREEHHHESDDIGEFYCDQMPTGDVACDNCRDVNGDRMEWPCPTVAALAGKEN